MAQSRSVSDLLPGSGGFEMKRALFPGLEVEVGGYGTFLVS